MLSQENINKINMNGLYKCKPDAKYRGKLFEDNLYHCCNWTFRVRETANGTYYMVDTYWSSGDNVHIQLSDENFDEFELLFDQEKVKQIKKDECYKYENVYRVAIDSGGWSYPKHFVDINATKSKELILEEINKQIKQHELNIKYLNEKKEGIENGTYNLEWY